MDQQEVAQPTAEDIIAGYIKLRSSRERLVAKHKEEVKQIDQKLALFEVALQDKMQREGVKSFNTEAGTAYRVTTEHASVSDMEAFLDFVKTNDAWHLLERRVSKLGVRGYLDENLPVPPGVNWYTSTSVNVRKPSER